VRSGHRRSNRRISPPPAADCNSAPRRRFSPVALMVMSCCGVWPGPRRPIGRGPASGSVGSDDRRPTLVTLAALHSGSPSGLGGVLFCMFAGRHRGRSHRWHLARSPGSLLGILAGAFFFARPYETLSLIRSLVESRRGTSISRVPAAMPARTQARFATRSRTLVTAAHPGRAEELVFAAVTERSRGKGSGFQ